LLVTPECCKAGKTGIILGRGSLACRLQRSGLNFTKKKIHLKKRESITVFLKIKPLDFAVLLESTDEILLQFSSTMYS